MANSYYNHTSAAPGQNTFGASATMRAEFDAIVSAFNLMPSLGAGVANQVVVVNSSGTALVSTASPALTSPTLTSLLGDMTNATLTSRFFAQSTVANGVSDPLLLPNGSATQAAWWASNNSVPTNSGIAKFGIDAGSAFVDSSVAGTGTQLPFQIRIGGTTYWTVSTTGGLNNAAPSSGAASTMNGVSGANVLVLNGATNSGTDLLSMAFSDTATFGINIRNNNVSGNVSYSLQGQNATITGTVRSSATPSIDLWVFTNHPLQFGTNNTTRVVIGNAGNVTINSPTSGTAAALAVSMLSTGFQAATFTNTNATNTTYCLANFLASGTGVDFGVTGAGSTPASAAVIRINSTDRVYVTANGLMSVPSGTADLGANNPLQVAANANTTTTASVTNLNAGTSAHAALNIVCGAGTFAFSALASGGGSLGDINWNGTGGIRITANNASGSLTFNTGGFVTRGTVASTGGWTLATPTSGNHQFNGLTQYSDGTTNAEIGWRTLPQNIQNANYTTVLADSARHIYHTSATAHTYTIDSNANVAYPIGAVLTFVNENGGGNVTIAITSDTLRQSPGGATGSRTLAANGRATALKVTATSWQISGTALT